MLRDFGLLADVAAEGAAGIVADVGRGTGGGGGARGGKSVPGVVPSTAWHAVAASASTAPAQTATTTTAGEEDGLGAGTPTGTTELLPNLVARAEDSEAVPGAAAATGRDNMAQEYAKVTEVRRWK